MGRGLGLRGGRRVPGRWSGGLGDAFGVGDASGLCSRVLSRSRIRCASGGGVGVGLGFGVAGCTVGVLSRTGSRHLMYGAGTSFSTGTSASTIHLAIVSRNDRPAGLSSAPWMALIRSARVPFPDSRSARAVRTRSVADRPNPASITDTFGITVPALRNYSYTEHVLL